MRSNVRPVAMILTVCVAWAAAEQAMGQNIQLRISGDEAFVGEVLRVQIILSNMTQGVEPIPPETEDFDITPDPGNPVGSSQRLSIINGRRMQSVDYTFLYHVRPRRTGRLVLPPFRVTYKGRVFRTRKVPIRVKKDTSGTYLFCEIKAQPESAYVGQPVDLTLEIWVRRYSQRGIGALDAGSMWNLRDMQATTPGVFDQVDWNRPRYYEATRPTEEGDSAKYYVYLIETTVHPTKAGLFDFGDVAVAYHYPKRLGRDSFFFSRWRVEDSRHLRAQAKTPALEIKPIPTEGRPKDFNGAVGTYTITTWAKPTEVPVGDPITLTMAIGGSGPLDRLSPPRLEHVEALTRDFEISGQSLAGEIKGSRKLFSQTIRALREDVTEIPPIPMSYFDPQAGRFETSWSDPIALTVKPAERLALSSLSEVGTTGGVLMPLVETTEGLLANETDAAVVLADQSGRLGPVWWIVLTAMPAVYLVTWLVQRRAARFRDDEALRRRSRAYAAAKKSLRSAGDGTSWQRAGTALITYIADRCNVPAGGLTRLDAVKLIAERRVPEETVRAVDELLKSLEQARYGGGAEGMDHDAVSRTWQLVNTLERCKLK